MPTTPSIIRGKKVSLHPIALTDAMDIFRENIGDVPKWFFAFGTQEAANDWVKETMIEVAKGLKYEFVMRNEQGEFVGMIAVHSLDAVPEFGLWTAVSQRGRGYAADAVVSAAGWLFSVGEIDTILYATELTNIASIRLAESLGLLPVEGVVRDGIPHAVFLAKKIPDIPGSERQFRSLW